MNKEIKTVNNLKTLEKKQLQTVTGGNIVSQIRDMIWGAADGYNGHRHGNKYRHRA